MTVMEAGSRYGISEQFLFLVEAGMDMDSLKKLTVLQQEGDSMENQIRILRKFRFEILDDIHKKQQCLDSVDFLISQIRQKGGKSK